MSAPALVARLVPAVTTAAPPLLKRIGTRIDVEASAKAIISAIRANPLTALLVGVEVFGAADPLIRSAIGNNAAYAAVVDQIGNSKVHGDSPDYVADTMSDDDFSQILALETKYADEMETLSMAAAVLGGLENLQIVMNACRLGTNIQKYHYKKVRGR